jgi:formate dehydrogenase major subunit
MTGRTRNNELRPADLLDISPADAAAMSLRHGQLVRVASRYGTVTLPVRVNSAIHPGHLFATFQRPDVLVNAVTGTSRDRMTGTPEYKVTAVRIEREM